MNLKLVVLFLSALTGISANAISVADTGLYSQNFDSLGTTTGQNLNWANNSTIEGWYLFNSTASAVPTYRASTGTDTTGAFYSFGNSGDRAIGGIGSGATYFGSPASGAVAGWIAVSFLNTSGGVFDGFAVGWNGEQWRNNGNTSAQTMVFEYGFGASFSTVSSWHTPGGAFDWSSPVHDGASGALDGNSAANRVLGVGGSISGLTWADGETLWFRWTERNDSGSDHGLGIDDFSFRADVAAVTGNVPDTLPVGFSVAALLALVLFHRCSAIHPAFVRIRSRIRG